MIEAGATVAAVCDRRSTKASAVIDRRYSSHRAISLPELLIVVAVIGILAAIAIPNIAGVAESSRDAFSEDAVALANRAVQHYEQAGGPIGVAASGASSGDEVQVVRKLKARDDAIPGSPFLDAQFSERTDNTTATHRMVWNGANFEVRLPGQAGAGILIGTD